MSNSEEWRPIPGFSDAFASSNGRIKQREKIRSQSRRNKNRKYLSVALDKKVYQAHRLICAAFHGNPPVGKPEVMHMDNNPCNNEPENLKWGTHAENMAMDRGNNHSHKGEDNPNSKLSPEAVKEIRSAYERRTNQRWGRKTLAAKFGITP
jgi:hypothetical protein